MKTNKLIPSIIIALIISLNANVFAQNVLDGVYVKEHNPARKPITYVHLREADMNWSKRIWRIVDLREKMNHPLYFPTTPINERKSFIDVLQESIKGDLTAYSDQDDRFTLPLTQTEKEKLGGAGNDTIVVVNPDTGEEEKKVTKKEFFTPEVKQYMIKEDWFFDRQRSVMEVRIIGIAPIRFYTKEGSDEIFQSRLYWIYYPELRPIIAAREVYNPVNDAERKTYDDIFWKRKFSSYIIKESNVYDDRRIASYRQGMFALLEAEKVKDDIFKWEHDLWEF